MNEKKRLHVERVARPLMMLQCERKRLIGCTRLILQNYFKKSFAY